MAGTGFVTSLYSAIIKCGREGEKLEQPEGRTQRLVRASRQSPNIVRVVLRVRPVPCTGEVVLVLHNVVLRGGNTTDYTCYTVGHSILTDCSA